mgnify:FL=1
MAIELISTIKPKNGGSFPIAEANDIKGGYYSVESIEIMENIPIDRRSAGMLCYVIGDKIYKLNDTLDTWNELNVAGGESSQPNGIWIGKNPPPDNKYILWIDISDESIEESFSNQIIDEFKNILTTLTSRILKLESRVTYLEQFHGQSPDIPDIPSTTDTLLVNENGFVLVNESGQMLCGNIDNQTISVFKYVTNENNQLLVNETNQILCFSIGSDLLNEVLTNEDGKILINEENKTLVLDLYNMLLTNENDDYLTNEDNNNLKL